MFCSPRLASVIQEDNFVCIFLCEIFILALSCLALMSAIWGFLDQGLFTTGFFTQACLYSHLWDFYSITVISCLNVSNMGFARPMVFINRFFFNTGSSFCRLCIYERMFSGNCFPQCGIESEQTVSINSDGFNSNQWMDEWMNKLIH